MEKKRIRVVIAICDSHSQTIFPYPIKAVFTVLIG